MAKKKLPPRPNLDHLRRQAKKLLATMNAPKRGTFRLADAQFEVAQQSGFGGWPALAHHVRDLKALEGEWRISALTVDGNAVPSAVAASTRILIDGDRFRTESPEATYEGEFIIDVEAAPKAINIEFVEGPEAGNSSYGIYEIDGDRFTLCLGLVGTARPTHFASKHGSGHALEQLTRASTSRPSGVTGGARKPKAQAASAPAGNAADFPVSDTPILRRLAGEWAAIDFDQDGKPMPKEWLAYGKRTFSGNETTIIFNGQTMMHARMRVDESSAPIAVDYLNLAGSAKGTLTFGIMEWEGNDLKFLTAAAGKPRPSAFTTGKGLTLTRWRRNDPFLRFSR